MAKRTTAQLEKQLSSLLKELTKTVAMLKEIAPSINPQPLPPSPKPKPKINPQPLPPSPKPKQLTKLNPQPLPPRR
jgi:hypothetical protein